MRMRTMTTFAALLLLAIQANAADGKTSVWTDTDAEDLPADYALQGEYEGTVDENKLGAQVISLGKGEFQAVLFLGGLPGDGWNGSHRALMAGSLKDGVVTFSPAEGDRKYLAGPADKFSATKQFPPRGNIPAKGTLTAEGLKVSVADLKFDMKRVVRKSPTMGMKPPEGATVLFDGSNADAFDRGRIDDDKELNTDGKDIRTKKKYNDYTIHVEFMLPYRPEARGQGRANSGFYQVDHYEVQILDSFGLEGLNNECGGVYTKANPLVNMCLPPLQWQTYDVTFRNARTADGKVTEPAVLTVKHNGVLIHDELKIEGKTGGSRNEPLGTPGVLKFQGHGNPVQFRNMWIIEN